MASEAKVSVSLSYDDGTISDFLDVIAKTFSPATLKFVKHIQSIGTSEEALDLGEVTPRLLLIVNLDATNYVEVKAGLLGTIIAKLDPGFPAFIPLGSGMQAPTAIANTAACRVAIFLISL